MASPASAKFRWREQADYQMLRDTDRAGFAWEFLRRNAEYRRTAQAHGAHKVSIKQGREVREIGKEEARAAAPWGAHFPC